MDTGNFMRVTTQFDVASASNPVVMVWDFQLVATDEPVALIEVGEDITTAFISRYLIPLEPFLSNKVTLTQVDIRAWAFPADGYVQLGALWQGNNADAMLPPFVAVSFRLARQNFAMRNGRKAFPGACITHAASNGTFNASVADALALITEVWTDTPFLVESDVSDMTFEERIVRVPSTADTDPTVWSVIGSFGRAYFGSQNSRK